jgi:ferritin-like protein
MSIKDSMIAESGEAQTTIAHHLYRLIADEWLSYYQYWTAYNMSRGEGKFDVDPEFEEHAE